MTQGIWERATFTVPLNTPHERVMADSYIYANRFGKHLEAQGFTVLEMLQPQITSGRLPTDEDRKRYDLFAYVTRGLREVHTDVPDSVVPELQAKGLKLND